MPCRRVKISGRGSTSALTTSIVQDALYVMAFMSFAIDGRRHGSLGEMSGRESVTLDCASVLQENSDFAMIDGNTASRQRRSNRAGKICVRKKGHHWTPVFLGPSL